MQQYLEWGQKCVKLDHEIYFRDNSGSVLNVLCFVESSKGQNLKNVITDVFDKYDLLK